jgi:hypothetical protein
MSTLLKSPFYAALSSPFRGAKLCSLKTRILTLKTKSRNVFQPVCHPCLLQQLHKSNAILEFWGSDNKNVVNMKPKYCLFVVFYASIISLAWSEVRHAIIAYATYVAIMLEFAILLVISFVIELNIVYVIITTQLCVVQLFDQRLISMKK